MQFTKYILLLIIVFALPSTITSEALCENTFSKAISEAVSNRIRNVIEKQIESLKKNDSETAFMFASPNIREQFGTHDNFMRMIKENYSVILSHSSFEFRDLEKLDNIGFVQTVFFEKKSGKAILAMYFMELQPNGKWYINGCKLIAAAGIVTEKYPNHITYRLWEALAKLKYFHTKS